MNKKHTLLRLLINTKEDLGVPLEEASKKPNSLNNQKLGLSPGPRGLQCMTQNLPLSSGLPIWYAFIQVV